ncbi:MAG: hypothetical protein E6H93_07970 [Chloroflexi bacterium]|nr:MAG: hypothetical protein E6H93_07970 [Chloroflexota bacterium]
MSLGRSLVRFLALSAIGHELTYTVVKAHRFDDAREQLVSLSVGFLLAGIYRPNLLADTGARRRSAVRRVANLAADAVLIGIGTRRWHDILVARPREIPGMGRRVDHEVADRIEIERASLPGISIRS